MPLPEIHLPNNFCLKSSFLRKIMPLSEICREIVGPKYQKSFIDDNAAIRNPEYSIFLRKNRPNSNGSKIMPLSEI